MNEKISQRKNKVRGRKIKTALMISMTMLILLTLSFVAFKIVNESMDNTESKQITVGADVHEPMAEADVTPTEDEELLDVEKLWEKQDEELQQKLEADDTESSIVNNDQEMLTISNSAYLDVKWIAQNPELPTGCEITSLTTVLQYYGYPVSKTTMASQYLEKGWGSFFETFIGDPFSENGYGCMALPIVNAANKYFTSNNINAYAQNVSGSEFTDLLEYVAGGDPVVIWNTMYMEKPYISESWYYNGELISWVAPEHCVVLIGYDMDKGEVYVSDPLEGIVTRNMNLFAEYYEAVYSQAVVIQR